jgi:hypothetical protein
MEEVLDAIIEQIDLLADTPREDGGFRDEIPLVDDVWFGDPKILPSQNYPFIYVEPVTSEKTSETTQSITRRLTIRVGIVTDPTEYWSEEEVVETSGSREMVRAIESIEQRFEKKTIRNVGDLAPGVTAVDVGTTTYNTQVRGDYLATQAEIIILVDVKRSTLSA